jgi:hypothetical protein
MNLQLINHENKNIAEAEIFLIHSANSIPAPVRKHRGRNGFITNNKLIQCKRTGNAHTLPLRATEFIRIAVKNLLCLTRSKAQCFFFRSLYLNITYSPAWAP